MLKAKKEQEYCSAYGVYIKQIHYLVLADKKDDRGVYRKIPVKIMGAKHEPVQPYLIQPKMEQLLEFYNNSTEHIIPRHVRFHIEFEGIRQLTLSIQIGFLIMMHLMSIM